MYDTFFFIAVETIEITLGNFDFKLVAFVCDPFLNVLTENLRFRENFFDGPVTYKGSSRTEIPMERTCSMIITLQLAYDLLFDNRVDLRWQCVCVVIILWLILPYDCLWHTPKTNYRIFILFDRQIDCVEEIKYFVVVLNNEKR